jgi:TonB-dependent starch-binding outer membrane protein SusC
MKKIILTMLFGLGIMLGAVAQNRTITGKVVDEKGKAIQGASVTSTDNKGTKTDENGNFSLVVGKNARAITVSSLNYENQRASLSGGDVKNFTLQPADSKLTEVVVVGFGTKTIRETTSAISKVKGDKLAESPLASFDQSLAGKTAGVQVSSTGGILGDGVSINIRGVNSISNSSQPLIVIDGIPQIELTNLNGFNGGNGTRFNPLALINPADIESVEVLKDAGATAIYGSRAANGVLLITTKKGKNGVNKISADFKYGVARAAGLPELLNGDDFISIANQKVYNRFGTSTANTIAKESDINGDGVNDRTDWLKELYRQAITRDYSIGMSGATDKSNYFGSVRYVTQEGISLGNKLTTGQTRLNIELTPKKWFKSGIEFAYSKTLNNGILSDRYAAGSVVGWQALPNVAVYNPAGPEGLNLTTTPVPTIGIMAIGNNARTYLGNNLTTSPNPVATVKLSRQNNTAQDFRGSFFVEIQPIKGLRMTSKFGVQNIDNFEDQYTSPYLSGLGNPYNGLVQNQTQYNKLWNWQNYISLDKKIGAKHRVGATVGSDFQKNNYNYFYVGAANFADPFFQYLIDGAYTNVQPGTTTTLNLTGGNKISSGIEAYFSRVNYAFAGKYFVEGSYRADAYSGFGANNKWGYFPSVSAGWEVTKESFMQNLKAINYLKLRGSYGIVGNKRGIGEYAARQLFSGAVYTTSTGLGNLSSGNAGLKWETSKKTDIGFELGILKNKVTITYDYFKNNINNLVLDAPVLYTVGVPNSRITTNIGSMQNEGYELTVNATPYQTKNFTWTTSANYTNVRNKVKSLVPQNNNADIISGLSVASVGRPMSTFFLPNWAGVDPSNGNPMWKAANGTIKRYNLPTGTAAGTWTDEKGVPTTPLAAADYQYQEGKQGTPTWYGGFDNNFRYKEFELSISTFFQGGNYIYNNTRALLVSNSFVNNGQEIKEAWTTPGQTTAVPKIWFLDNTANQASTRFLEKGDFLKIRSITAGYNFNKVVLSKIGLENIRAYISLFNVLTITGYKGADPEVNTNRFDNIGSGVDLRNVPQSRSITAGIQLTF